jgi:hypothetical protein
MIELTGRPGFAPPKPERIFSSDHAVALELIATLALTASLIVAASAVALANRSLARSCCAEPPVVQALPPLR